MRQTRFIRALVAMFLAFPLASTAHAQVTSATIVGTVTDSSGAALPGASVTARNVDTGFNRTVPSNEDGAYRLEFLPIGGYIVEVTLSGFKTSTRSGIVLNVNDTVRVDAALSLGGVAETVNVEAETPAVNTSTSDISRTIDAAAIESLPLVDRNVYTLLDLTPGVQSNNNGVASASSGTNSLILGFPEQRTLINGGADGGTGSVNYYLDGGINMTGLRNTGNILPNPDAIQEFKVQTNSYNVEYGRFSSGIINVVTKSGTNRYKGSVFEYVRDGKMNAKEWGAVLATPPLKRNQFGGTFGGPLAHDRTFFFTTYSGLRQTTNTFLQHGHRPDPAGADRRLQRVEDAADRSGDRADVRLQRRRRRDLPQPARSRGDEDHQRLHSAVQRRRRHLAGLRAEPLRQRRDPDQARPPDERRASLQRQLLPDEGLEHGEGRLGQSAVGQPAVQVAAAQRQSQRHLGDQHEQDQPDLVLVQPQLRRPSPSAGGLAHGPRIEGRHPGGAVAAADYRQRVLHADQRDRRAEGGRRLLLGARRLQLDHAARTPSSWAASSRTTRPSRTRCSTTTASSRSTTA